MLVVVAMATGYHRIELDHCLDIDEVAKRMVDASEGKMIDMKPNKAKETDCAHDWKGMVRLPHTAPDRGRSKEDIIGITDYEYFGRKVADRKQ